MDVNESDWKASLWLQPILDANELRLSVRKGRIISRKGRVTDLEVRRGIVTAAVRNDDGGFLHVKIRMDSVGDDVWSEVIGTAAEEAALAGELLRGQLSERLADLFEDAGHGLFPFDLRDVSSYCSCHDAALVCTHAFATHLEFVRVLQSDPMIFLQFRGKDREWLVNEVRSRRDASGEVEIGSGAGPAFESVDSLVDGYWERGVMPALAFRIDPTELSDLDALPVLRALGPGPSNTDPEDVVSVLKPLMRVGRMRVDDVMEQVGGEGGNAEASPKPTDTESLDEVLIAAAHQHGQLTSGFVAEALGCSSREARQYLQWLVEEGRLSVVGRARGTKYLPVD
ncbi:MAG: putative Zn finger protein [Myxococcota bacterium]|jgi:uncharacterized Zn finger protein